MFTISILLYETIIEERKGERPLTKSQSGYTKECTSVRGKKFNGNYVHSIVKKKRLKDEKLVRQYPEVCLILV